MAVPNKKLALLVLLATFWLGWCSGNASGQTTTGSIYGTVADKDGSVLPNATVTATNVQTGESHTTKSNASGNYVFPALPPADYKVAATSQGFETELQSGLRLDANQNAHVTFSLKPGSVNESVTVTASTALVDTRESQVGETVDQKRIEDLPLNGRNAYDLLQLVPGVTAYSQPAPNGNQNGTSFAVNGNRKNQNTFYLDGSFDTGVYNDSGNMIPNPDALQEFRVLTSNFDAEYGRAPGGVVNIITRSGTNVYHGLLYDYFRNDI